MEGTSDRKQRLRRRMQGKGERKRRKKRWKMRKVEERGVRKGVIEKGWNQSVRDIERYMKELMKEMKQ